MAKQQNQTVGAFVINNEAEYPWTVYVYVPNPKGGGKLKTKFRVLFAHMTPEERMGLLEEFRDYLKKKAMAESGDFPQDGEAAEAAIDLKREVTSFEDMLLRRVVRGFDGIMTPDRSEFPFNDENRDKLISNSWARDAMVHAYSQSLVGRSDQGN